MNLLPLAATSLPEAGPVEVLDAAAAAGFAGVGLRINWPPSRAHLAPPLGGDVRLLAELKRRLAATGLQVLDLYSFYLTAEFDFAAARKQLELGAQLGARYAVTIGHDTQWSRACETFGKLCDLARPLGLPATLEFAPHRHPMTLQQARQMLADVRRPNAAIMPDPAHLLASGGAVADLRSVDPGTFAHSQICGVTIAGEEYSAALARPVPKIERTVPGTGSVALADWLDALPEGIPLSVEGPPTQPGVCNAAWAKTLYSSARAALDDYYRHKHS